MKSFRQIPHSSSAFRVPRSAFARRAGLAPLEMTLTLPILVMMMALMIDFGIVGAWKVRTQVNTRYAAWRTVNARTGEYNSVPPYWPANAPLNTNAGMDLPYVSQAWDSQQPLLCPCIRGPQLTAPNAKAAITVKGRLEMDGFVLEGNAQLQRTLPLLQGALPNGGQFQFNLKQDIFDNQWQFYSLNIPYNTAIRANVWWNIEHSDLAALDPAINSNLNLLNQNLQKLQTSPQRADLYPLDRDDEFTRYSGFPPPDFYPRLGFLCESDPTVVYAKLVATQGQNGKPNQNSLLGRINNLPCSMSKNFTFMYASWICNLEKCGFPEAQIDPLRQRYNDLAQFMKQSGCTNPPAPGPLTGCHCPENTTCTCPPSPVGVGH